MKAFRQRRRDGAPSVRRSRTPQEWRGRGGRVTASNQIRAAVDLVSMPMVISRATDGVILHANALLGPLFGLQSHTLVGLKPPDFYADHADHDALLAALDRDGYVRDREVRARKADGTEIWLAVSLRRITFDGDPALLAGFHDITQGKRAEEALRESEKHHTRVIESVAQAIEEIDTSGLITFANAAHHRQYEYAEGELIGMSIFDFVATDSERDKLRDYVQYLVAEQPPPTPYFGQKRTKSGRIIDVEVAWNYKLDAQRQVTGFISVIADITQRKRAEAALRESEELTRSIIDTAYDAFISMDADGLITDWNAQAEATFGWSRQETLRRKLSDTIIPPELRQAHLRGLKHFLASGEGPVLNKRIEITALHRDGHEFPVELAIWSVGSGEARTFNAFVADISERKRAEAALRESEELYRALVETSPDGISLTDLEGRVTFCNKQALALLGFESMQEVLGRNAFDLIAPEDRQRAMDNAQRTLRMKSLSHIEYTLVRKDGSRVPVELGASVVVDAEGIPKGFIGVVRDITERRETEESLKMARDELESRVERFAHRGNAYDLTFRELTVLHLVAEGKSDGEIAATLGISPRTASKHMENILAKMAASSRTEVGVRAVREQLLG